MDRLAEILVLEVLRSSGEAVLEGETASEDGGRPQMKSARARTIGTSPEDSLVGDLTEQRPS